MIEWLIKNWIYILVVMVILFFLVYGFMTGKVKIWLQYAVTEAERELGSNTGQLKLRQVYDWFTFQFPMFSRIVPFIVFSKWVDLALDWMRDQLAKNDAIKAVVTGE